MAIQEPKKTTQIYTRVPDSLKREFKTAIGKLGLTEAFFVRAAAEAIIHQTKSGEDLALPIRLMTVQERERRKKK